LKAFVLDASLALEWFTNSASEPVLAKRSLFDDRVALVPHLWRFEVMNAVTMWRRSKIVSSAQASRLLRDLMTLPFAVVEEGSAEAIVELAVQQGLTAYDATYVHASMVTGEPLATLDSAMRGAARKVGVECL